MKRYTVARKSVFFLGIPDHWWAACLFFSHQQIVNIRWLQLLLIKSCVQWNAPRTPASSARTTYSSIERLCPEHASPVDITFTKIKSARQISVCTPSCYRNDAPLHNIVSTYPPLYTRFRTVSQLPGRIREKNVFREETPKKDTLTEILRGIWSLEVPLKRSVRPNFLKRVCKGGYCAKEGHSEEWDLLESGKRFSFVECLVSQNKTMIEWMVLPSSP